MLIALASASSRALLNLIDRYQIGHRGMPVLAVNFWNNALPAIVLVASVLASGWHRELGSALMEPGTIVFSGFVQLVAYAYSQAFRRLKVSQVTVAGKAADLFISVGVFLTVGSWNWATYGFAVATTAICLPLLRGRREGLDRSAMRGAALCIGGALVLQASLSPWLASTALAEPTVRRMLVFATAVIVWRVAWSALPLLRGRHRLPASSLRELLASPLFLGRTALTVFTQVTFVAAVGSRTASVAWPILNSTGLLAMVLSAVVFRERPSRLEVGIVMSITGLAVLRFITL